MSVQNLRMNPPAVAPPQDALGSALSAAARRIRALMFLRLGSYALCGSALLCLVLVGLSKTRLWEEPSPWLVAGIIGAALLSAAVVVLCRRLTQLDVARLTDRRTDLKERLS